MSSGNYRTRISVCASGRNLKSQKDQQATFELNENENSCGGLQDARFFDRQSRKLREP